ncbi:hypothetical protein [Mannheimia massilioguelmaensis]|uniref:hypothetical protein n=1 Tax=Mannheimia massilioguelmaensis TaxID=1604354 RepID=UPI000ADB9F93|nr:hypothetical protein [Mannheimia massilioguelmaensis]
MQLTKRQDTALEIADLIQLLESTKDVVLDDKIQDADKLLTLVGRDLKKLHHYVKKSLN